MNKSYNSVTKAAMRKEYRTLRTKYYTENINHDDDILLHQEEFLQLFNNNRRKIFIYWSISDEFPTHNIIRHLLEEQKEVYLPKIIGKDMLPAPITSVDDVTYLNSFSIPEPESLPVTTPMDLVLVPGLAFDRFGGRLGYGGGYYDRYLNKYPSTLAYGLAYDFQLTDQVPMEDHDCYLHGVITPTKVYHRFQKNKI